MKTILCYGDSNTYGYIPETGMRYPRDVRYPGRLQMLLGTGIRTSPFYGAFYEEAVTESKRFPECYKAVAEAKGCIFFDAAEYIYPSEVDSLHLTPEGHKILAEKLSGIVKRICEQ